MPFLTFLRHAKTAPPLAGQEDFDRPLTERGRSDATRMGKLLVDLALDLALVSAAARTTETWAIASADFAAPLPPTVEQSLYLCRAAHLIQRLREVPPEIQSVVVVGHNPCLQEVALWLAGKTKAPAVGQMREKFPTCAFATFELTASGWSDLSPKTVTFTRFAAPRMLGIAVAS
jgi:phosphohistidine phosphatase